MERNEKELPRERLSSTDESGHHVKMYPAQVHGRFKKIREKVQFILMLIFLILPWIKVGGHQALLFDISSRKFAIFGLMFFAHDAPKLLFVVVGLIALIAMVTAIFGRAWCGWACPETVFIEAVYRRIERWVEGDHLKQKQLDQQAFTAKWIQKKLIKWTGFFAVSAVISHSFLAYFVGTERLLAMIQASPAENPTPFFFMAGITIVIAFAFGWFREQFCIIMCPYGRLQGLLLDSHSLTVAYDEKRGEPRRGVAATKEDEGDCINCYRCVAVCPTGIDIRRGVAQLECIGCTACIDACDDVMGRLKRPLGLIRYTSERELAGQKRRNIRFRSIAYFILMLAMVVGLVWAVAFRVPVNLNILRAKETPYQVIPGEAGKRVVNHFYLDARNQESQVASLRLKLLDSSGAQLIVATPVSTVQPGEHSEISFFIQFPLSLLKEGRMSKKIEIEGLFEELPSRNFSKTLDLKLVGPFD